MPNPFFYGGRVNPEQFVGRRAELQRIFAGLEVAHTGQMQSFSVVGPRRIGKSSLLFYIANRYARDLTQAAQYRFGYVELQDAHCKTLDGLFRTILDSLQVSSSEALTLAKFQDEILKLKAAGNYPVVCLDEFETLAQKTDVYDRDLYDCWRHLMNENAIAFITASKTPLIDLAQTLGYTSPFFNVFTYLPLGELTDDEARTLIARGADCDRAFTPTEQSDALLLAGKHPYKLQLAGGLLYEVKANSSIVDWDWVRREFHLQLEQVGLEEPVINETTPQKIQGILRRLLTSPRYLGRAILDLLGRDKAADSSALIVGWAIIIIVLAVAFGWIGMELLTGWYSFFTGAGKGK